MPDVLDSIIDSVWDQAPAARPANAPQTPRKGDVLDSIIDSVWDEPQQPSRAPITPGNFDQLPGYQPTPIQPDARPPSASDIAYGSVERGSGGILRTVGGLLQYAPNFMRLPGGVPVSEVGRYAASFGGELQQGSQQPGTMPTNFDRALGGLPEMGMNIAPVVAASAVGGPVAGAAVGGLMQAGGTVADTREALEAKGDPNARGKALGVGAVSGVAGAALNFLPIARALGPSAGAILPGIQARVANIASRYGAAAGENALAGLLQSAVDQNARIAAGAQDRFDDQQAFDVATENALIGVGIRGVADLGAKLSPQGVPNGQAPGPAKTLRPPNEVRAVAGGVDDGRAGIALDPALAAVVGDQGAPTRNQPGDVAGERAIPLNVADQAPGAAEGVAPDLRAEFEAYVAGREASRKSGEVPPTSDGGGSLAGRQSKSTPLAEADRPAAARTESAQEPLKSVPESAVSSPDDTATRVRTELIAKGREDAAAGVPMDVEGLSREQRQAYREGYRAGTSPKSPESSPDGAVRLGDGADAAPARSLQTRSDQSSSNGEALSRPSFSDTGEQPLSKSSAVRTTREVGQGKGLPIAAEDRAASASEQPVVRAENVSSPKSTTPPAKQPWEMRADEWQKKWHVASPSPFGLHVKEDTPQQLREQIRLQGGAETPNGIVTHRDVIAKALREGRPVPPEVLADYPDLAPPAPVESTTAGGRGAVPPKAAWSKPIKGKTGAEIVGYEWRSKMGEKFKPGEGWVEGRVSDWDSSDVSTQSGRDIVHVFYVKSPDGTIKAQGIESAKKLLGFTTNKMMTMADNARRQQEFEAGQDRSEVAQRVKGAKSTAGEALQSWEKINKGAIDAGHIKPSDAAIVEKDGQFIAVLRSDKPRTAHQLLMADGWRDPATPKIADATPRVADPDAAMIAAERGEGAETTADISNPFAGIADRLEAKAAELRKPGKPTGRGRKGSRSGSTSLPSDFTALAMSAAAKVLRATGRGVVKGKALGEQIARVVRETAAELGLKTRSMKFDATIREASRIVTAARRAQRGSESPGRASDKAIRERAKDQLAAYGISQGDAAEQVGQAGRGSGSFTFHKKLPPEVREEIKSDPALRRLFTVTDDATKAGGADAMSDLGDKYFDLASVIAGSDSKRAMKLAEKGPDEGLRFLAEVMKRQQGKRPESETINPARLTEGDTFKINGADFRIVSEGGRTKIEGDGFPTTDAAATGPLRVDKGSVSVDDTSIERAMAKPAPKPRESTAARVARITGLKDSSPETVTKREALDAVMRGQRKAADRAWRDATATMRADLRQKVAYEKQARKGADALLESVRKGIINTARELPASQQGDFLGEVARAKSVTDLNRVINNVQRRLDINDYREAAVSVRDVGRKELLALSADKGSAAKSPRELARDLIDQAKILRGKVAREELTKAQARDAMVQIDRALKVLAHEAKIENKLIQKGKAIDAKESRQKVHNALSRRTDLGTPQSGATNPGWIRKYIRFDFDPTTFTSLIDGQWGGKVGEVRRLIVEEPFKAREESHREHRKALEGIESAVRRAGYNGMSDWAARWFGTRGDKNTKYVDVKIDGRKLTVGEAAALVAMDPATREKTLAGNEWSFDDNRAKAHGVTGANLEDALNGLSREDTRLVRELKNLMQAFRPQLDEVHRRMHGVGLDDVADYFPTRRNMNLAKQGELPSAYRGAMAATHYENAGMLQDRTGGGTPFVLRNFVPTVLDYVQSVSRILHMSEAVRNAEVVLLERGVKEAIGSRFGEAGQTRIADLIADASIDRPPDPGVIGRAFAAVTRNSARTKVQLNPFTWARQVGGLSTAATKVDARDYVAGLKAAANIGLETKIEDAVPYFWNRWRQPAYAAQFAGMQSSVNKPSPRGASELVQSAKGANNLKGIGAFLSEAQDAVPVGGWADATPARFLWGAFESQAKRENPTWDAEKRTEWVADQTVRAFRATQNTVGAGEDTGLTRALRRSPFTSPITAFKSDVIKKRQMLYQAAAQGPREVLKAAAGIMGSVAWSAGISALQAYGVAKGIGLAVDAVRGTVNEEDEKKRAMEAALSSERRLYNELASLVPYVGTPMRDIYKIVTDLRRGDTFVMDSLGGPVVGDASKAVAGSIEAAQALLTRNGGKDGILKGSETTRARKVLAGLEKALGGAAGLGGLGVEPLYRMFFKDWTRALTDNPANAKD